MSEEKKVPTSEKLAQALEAANAPRELIEKARAKYYDDCCNLTLALKPPTMQLAIDARIHGLDAIADRAISGEFGAVSTDSGIRLVGVKVKREE